MNRRGFLSTAATLLTAGLVPTPPIRAQRSVSAPMPPPGGPWNCRCSMAVIDLQATAAKIGRELMERRDRDIISQCCKAR